MTGAQCASLAVKDSAQTVLSVISSLNEGGVIYRDRCIRGISGFVDFTFIDTYFANTCRQLERGVVISSAQDCGLCCIYTIK